MRKLLLAAAALAGTLAASVSAMAAPTLSYRIYEDNKLVVGPSGTTSSGALTPGTITTPSGNFTISLSAFGIPVLDAPNMASQTTSVSTAGTFTGTHSIVIEVTQIDVPVASVGAGLASTFTANFLINGSAVTGVRIENFVDSANAAFGKTDQIATRFFNTGMGAYSFGPVVDSPALSGSLFSETMVFKATFSAPGAALQGSSQIVSVPEPASLALFGTGLLGLGLLRRARRKA